MMLALARNNSESLSMLIQRVEQQETGYAFGSTAYQKRTKKSGPPRIWHCVVRKSGLLTTNIS